MTNYVSSFANGAAVDAELTKVANSNLSATHKITRSATIVIAANDSSAKSKAQADYVCDGIDDQVEIQAAIDALPSFGGKIQLMEGNYSVNPLTEVYPAWGGGWNSAIVIGKSNVEISGTPGTILKIVTGATATAGMGIFHFDSKNNINIHNLIMDGNWQNISDITYVFAVLMTGTCSKLNLDHNHFNNFKYALYGDGTGLGTYGLITNNVFSPAGKNGLALHNSPDKTIISNNLFISPYNGIFLDTVTNCIVSQNILTGVVFRGIYIYDGAHDAKISDNIIIGATGTNTAIDAYTTGAGKVASDGLMIHNNSFDNFSTGIHINGAGNCIKNNKFTNISSTVLSDEGTLSRISGNSGYVTENTGTATIVTEGSHTSVDVTHGLAAAPTRVIITPTTSLGGKFAYVSAKAATTFTITIDSAHSADISFDWQAVV